jgi:hypothetical protein
VDKFEDCALYAKWARAKTESIVSIIQKLEEVPEITKLTQFC